MLMMKNKVLQEIDLIPEDKLADIYNFVHQFRLQLENTSTVRNRPTISFAGCWNDMPDDLFDEFIEEIEERRQNAFKRR